MQVRGSSFLHEWAGAMSSVENSFNKLLNDVVGDIKNTVHCTLLAIEQVLIMSGAVSETSNYNCYPHTDSVDNNYKLPLLNYKNSTERENRNNYSGKHIAQQISSSISNINKTLTNILDNDGHERLNHVKRVLQNEANHFTEVSRLLREELGKISSRLRNHLENIDSDKPSLESLWKDMKTLHNLEKNDRNVSEVNEIRKVLSDALNVLHLNTSSKVQSDEDKIGTIMRELEHESNNNKATFTNIDNELAQWKQKQSNLQSYSDETPKSFKDIASKMFKEKNNILKEIEKSPAEDNITAKDRAESTNSNFNSIFGATSKEEHQKAIDQARNIIEDSNHSEKMLEDFFARQEKEHTAVDVFNSK